jgi:hypothetical protein
MHEFSPTALVLDSKDLLVDGIRGFLVEDAPHSLEILHELLCTGVGIVLGVRHRVERQRGQDGQLRKLDRNIATSALSICNSIIIAKLQTQKSYTHSAHL